MKILIVDDHEHHVHLLRVRLERRGYDVIPAANGAEALEKARRDPPDLIISDILMPVMDGFTLCRKWKNDERLRGIPFIFYTESYTDPKDRELALNLRADRFILKSENQETFIQIVTEAIDDVKKGRIKACPSPSGEEKTIFKQYSERLMKKLEEKMRDLESEIVRRKKVEERIRELNRGLELRIDERTAQLAAANERLKREIEKAEKAEEETERARRNAERTNRAKSVFLANMSHELRTPLNHIIGFTELVVDKHFGDLNDTQEEYLNDALQSGRHLLSLVNDILDLSKVEAGKQEMEPSDVRLEMLFEGSLTMFRVKAMKHGIQLKIDISHAPETVTADERKLKQILYNLLSNAVKFTPGGGEIRLSADIVDGSKLKARCEKGFFPLSASDVERHRRWTAISVTDTGVGVKPEDLGRIFDPFEQVGRSARRGSRGTGLGLSLTRSLVELHGGGIWVESEGEGKGSTFTFVIPCR